jgi:hypothetical protein
VNCITSLRRVGDSQLGSSSQSASVTHAAAGYRFRLQFTTSDAGEARIRRRLAVADYLDGWLPLRIVAEHITGRRCLVWIELSRPVSAAAARDYVRGCPGYVPKSFRMLG